ncbi:unnamed protein product [Linum tenue]|uniref:Golgin candidate 1 n=1 Tax=Linum tenue TaxID=586396 RepID=A0AAV0SAU6_9ROSI|nr:unnamed protein product [Linum tenue]
MAAWLKAAEGLFEVVDRQAKLVVNELSEENSDSQPSASNGQGSQQKKPKPKPKSKSKAQKRRSKDESTKLSEPAQEVTNTPTSEAEAIDQAARSVKNAEKASSSSVAQTSNEQQETVDSASSVSLPTNMNEQVKHEADSVQIPITVTDPIIPPSDGALLNDKTTDVPAESTSSPSPAKEMEVVKEHDPVVAVPDTTTKENEGSSKIELEKSSKDSLVINEKSAKDDELKVESPMHQQKQVEHDVAASPRKIQEQLEEGATFCLWYSLITLVGVQAQGLLKTANSTGQSKEARLARVCAGLSTRLQEYKSENAQLEELLIAERELSKSCEARMKQLQQDLSVSKMEVTRVESNMAEALAAKNAEIEALLGSMDALKKQAALSEGSLASLQANMESLMRNRELTETRMMQALREELASAERRAEEERVAHNTTKKAAMEREVDLENRAVEASTALARTQRLADERTSKASELEQKVALLEVECATLNQELQDMEARVRRGQKKAPEELNQSIQMQAWQEEVERARQGQREAENKLSSVEAELQKLRVEMAAMKRDAEHYSRQEHMELEKRYRELTDLLYYKQTQLETMASDKAAAEFQLEKELKRIQEVQVEAERGRIARRPSPSWEEDSEMKALEYASPSVPPPFGGRKRTVAEGSKDIGLRSCQSHAILVAVPNSSADLFILSVTHTLCCAGVRTFLHDVFIASPSGINVVLFHSLTDFPSLYSSPFVNRVSLAMQQAQADDLSAREVAESMGLTDPNLQLHARR